VPFTLVYAGKYRSEEKLKIQTIQKLKTTQKNSAKQNYPNLVAYYDTQPGNKGLFYTSSNYNHSENSNGGQQSNKHHFD